MFLFIRPPEGRAYVLPVMLSFSIRHSFSEVPRPIALKLCHMVGIWCNFIIPLQKFGGLPPQKKKLGAKNMQNFGQFWTTSNFDREYLRNGSRYPKLDDATNYGCVSWKKSGELWSTNGLELHVSLDPLKCTYLGNYISAHRGFCAVIFLHALEIDQALLAHTPTGTGVPQNFLIMKI